VAVSCSRSIFPQSTLSSNPLVSITFSENQSPPTPFPI
jgi:hypothetical protein